MHDNEIYRLIDQETIRQQSTISLIASENYTSSDILHANASVLTNKYAEGYPGKRYYAGCEFVDEIERIAQERAKKLFGSEHANVQPHAGSQANMAVYFAALKPSDTILGMSLAAGGHLTHGHPVNFSGMYYTPISYHVDRETELLDYTEIENLAHQHKPKLIIAGASSYSRTIDFARFAQIAKSVHALLLVDMAHIAGLIAAKLHPSPVPYADFVSSTTHKTLRGPRGGFVLSTHEHAQAIDKAIMPGTQGGPCMHTIAAKAIAFEQATQPEFIAYQKQVLTNAHAMARALKDLGYRIVSSGTDNHLFIVDLRAQNITGLHAQIALERAGILVSKSCIPFDPEKPWITSGIRIGTPAMTTRGYTEPDALYLVELIDRVIRNYENEQTLLTIKKEIGRITKTRPIPC